MDGWIGRWMDGWMDGWIVCVCARAYSCAIIYGIRLQDHTKAAPGARRPCLAILFKIIIIIKIK